MFKKLAVDEKHPEHPEAVNFRYGLWRCGGLTWTHRASRSAALRAAAGGVPGSLEVLGAVVHFVCGETVEGEVAEGGRKIRQAQHVNRFRVHDSCGPVLTAAEAPVLDSFDESPWKCRLMCSGEIYDNDSGLIRLS